MSILNITPTLLALNLAITVDGQPGAHIDVAAPAIAPIALELSPGMPVNLQPVLDAIAGIPTTDLAPVLAAVEGIPHVDLAPVLAAIAGIPTTDLGPVLAAIAGIPATDLGPVLAAIAAIPSVDLAPVLDAIADVPHTDLAAALAAYAPATAQELTAAQAAVLAAIAGIPATNLQPVLTAIAGIPTTDVAAALVAYGAAKPADVTAARDHIEAHVDAAIAPLSHATDVTAARDHIEAASSTQHTNTQTAINSHTDSAVAPLATQLTTISAALAAIYPSGTVMQFLRGQIPAGWSEVGGTLTVPGGGMLQSSNAGTFGAGNFMTTYVSSGTAQGLWRLKLNVLQRFSIDTNAAIGPAYTVPGITPSSTGNVSFMVAVGQYLYLGGLPLSSGYSTAFFRFDTQAGTFSILGSFPKSLGAASNAVVLNDGRLLVTAVVVNAAINNYASAYFYLYNPANGGTPTEVVVALPATKAFADQGSAPCMAVLPTGEVLVIDQVAPASGNRLSCLLTISGNSITAGAGEDTGYLGSTSTGNAYTALSTDTGAFLLGGNRTYTKGSGWSGAPSGAAPWAYGSLSAAMNTAQRVPGLGYVLNGMVATGGGGGYCYLYLVSTSALSALIVSAKKN